MEHPPKVFVIILNWNGQDCLASCLRSVFALDYRNTEIVIVDNASRDGSLEEAKKSFSRAHFILNTENLGFAAGMNVGIRFALSKGADYVWILNNDVECKKNSLSALVSAAIAHEKPAFFSPHILTPKGISWFSGGKIDYFRMRAEHTLDVDTFSLEAPYPTGYLSGCALFFPRKAIEAVGLFDEGYFLYYEDTDLSVRAEKKGLELLVVPKSVVLHSEKSEENPEKIYWLVRSGLRFFRAHTPILVRPWMWIYISMRRIKNGIDKLQGKKGALPVSAAYADSWKA
ncbi:MAG: glycosyltransferase family 2 protein [Candidatus Moraniibacteriota bacterium]